MTVSLFAEEEGADLAQPGISFPGPAEDDPGRVPHSGRCSGHRHPAL